MSELKAINAYQLTTNTEDSDVYIHNDEFGCGGDLVECYLKSEADKYFADLEDSHKKEVGQLLILNREQANAANRLRDSMEQALRHQKYKRCLALKEVCLMELDYAFRDPCVERSAMKCVHWRKWANRWHYLAEMFKEAK